jgi:hypothetical protein
LAPDAASGTLLTFAERAQSDIMTPREPSLIESLSASRLKGDSLDVP